MMPESEELHDMVRSMLLVFIGRVRCSCISLDDSCGECDKRSKLEAHVVDYISHKRGRATIQIALTQVDDKRFDNLKMVEFSEFLDDLSDIYPNLDKSTTI
jgi:hypothetical protein